MSEIRFCPVCRAPGTKPLKEKISWSLKIQLALLTLACCLVIFMLLGFWPALKTAPVFFVFLGLAELIHWSQMRQNVRCEVCDFDPILYKEDWRRARSQVESKMQTAFNTASQRMKDTIDFQSHPMNDPRDVGSSSSAGAQDKKTALGTNTAKTLSSLMDGQKNSSLKN